jgi:flagellin-like hook-associated protein FlgL
MDLTEYRLSTGKKVNSALDDPVNYFAAQDHTQKASDFQKLKDSISEGIQTIKGADAGISSIIDLLDSAKSLAKSALSSTEEADVTSYMNEFSDLLDQITQLAADSGYAGINLLGSDELEIAFDETGDSKITVTGFDASSDGLGLTAVTTEWWDSAGGTMDADAINASLDELASAKSTLRAASKTLSSQLSTVTTREDFTTNMINILTDGANNLVNADTNEESARLLTLQTQQQLAINSLSIATDASQAVLKLF